MAELRPRLPRVAYSAPVRLSGEWSDREPWFVPLLAQSLDLSEGGMALVTPLHLRLGASVTASMRLGGQQAYLVGRVVWDRLAADGTKRVGIQFLTPSDAETGVMRRLLAVGQSHPHRVNLRFEGRPDTMTALARVTNSGLALSAPLPILRRDTAVRVAFEGLGPTFTGRVDRVRLAHMQGMPALHVAIRVSNAQGQADLPRPVPPRAPTVRVRDDATPTAVEVIAARRPPPRRPTRARRRLPAVAWAAMWLCALVAGALGQNAWTRWSRAQSGSMAATTAVSAARSAPRKTAATGAGRTPVGSTTVASAPVASAPVVSAPVAVADDARFAPRFKWRRDRRELFIPLDGALDSVRHFRMHAPSGIAIDAPHARGASQRMRYPVPPRGVSRVDVLPWKDGSRVRIWIEQPFSEYRVERAAGGIRVVLPVEP